MIYPISRAICHGRHAGVPQFGSHAHWLAAQRSLLQNFCADSVWRIGQNTD